MRGCGTLVLRSGGAAARIMLLYIFPPPQWRILGWGTAPLCTLRTSGASMLPYSLSCALMAYIGLGHRPALHASYLGSISAALSYPILARVRSCWMGACLHLYEKLGGWLLALSLDTATSAFMREAEVWMLAVSLVATLSILM